MSEESSTPRVSTPPAAESAAPPPAHNEMASLRKEVLEARNLIIKTDNLLKNLHAEVKKLGDRAEEQENRHWMTSVTAYVVFAVMAAVAAIAYARSEVRSAREEAQGLEARAAGLQKEAEKIKAADQVRRDASEKALRVYDLLGSEKEGPGLNQALQQSLHLDRAQISALEGKAIDDRTAGMKARMAEAALAAGSTAYRHQDWRGTSDQLGKYVELEGAARVSDNQVWYHLGSARMQTREYAGAIQPLEYFLKSAGGSKTAQYAGLLLGQAYEETNNPTRAREVFEHALNLYPGSEFAPSLRNHLRKLGAMAGPITGPTPTPPPPPAPAQAAAPKPQ
ncbi:MAG TPA: tetratricopeptide repeat protein [Myxococcales bacterium]|nr:tetratricopeptide repeat protein [Myxococcales bacterium]